MNQIIIDYMLEQYPDPDEALILAGEASLDATWPLTSPGVPSIRMLHNHFVAFPMEALRNTKMADANNPNLTDGGQHSLFQAYMRDVYREFFDQALNLKILKPASEDEARIGLTGYPQGLPSWEIQGGANTLKNVHFWKGIRRGAERIHRLLPHFLFTSLHSQCTNTSRRLFPGSC